MPPTAIMQSATDEMVQLTRSFEAQIADVNPGERSVVATINTDDVDRYRTVILPRGAILDGYRKNPIVLWEHGEDPARGSMPIGKNQWIKVDDRTIKAKTIFKDDEYSREIFKAYQEEWLRGWSVRMVNPDYGPLTADEVRSRPDWKDAKTIFRKWELGEYSGTAVPGNKDTLTILASRGIFIPARAMTDSIGGLSGGGAALKPQEGVKRYVKEVDGKWHVMSEAGKSLGEYDSKEAAEKRLGEIEYFKHKDSERSAELVVRKTPFVDTDGSAWWIDDNGKKIISFPDARSAEECLELMRAEPSRKPNIEIMLLQSLGDIRRAGGEIREMVQEYVDLYTRGRV